MGLSARLPRTSVIVVALSMVLAGSLQARDTKASAPDARISNFGKINAQYYRGAQPEGRDYANLAAAGVKTIVDLRNDAEATSPRI